MICFLPFANILHGHWRTWYQHCVAIHPEVEVLGDRFLGILDTFLPFLYAAGTAGEKKQGSCRCRSRFHGICGEPGTQLDPALTQPPLI